MTSESQTSPTRPSAGVATAVSEFHAARAFWLSLMPPAAPIAPTESPEPSRSNPASDVLADVEDGAGRQRTPTLALFRDEGEYWQIVYSGKCVGIRQLRGLLYLQHLLLHPYEKIHVSILAGLASEPRLTLPPMERIDSAITTTPLPFRDSGEVLDQRATQLYKGRLIELRAELDEATRWADRGRASSIRREIDFLSVQLSSAYGRNGRARKLDDPTERVRKAVTNRIRNCIDRVAKQMPALGRHLDNSIRTGFYCSYSPEFPVIWKP
jgi:hypothetical protein